MLLLVASGSLHAAHATIVDSGEVSVGAGGELQIGITGVGSRVVDAEQDGPYTGAVLGVGEGSAGRLELASGAGFRTTGPLIIGELGEGSVEVSGSSSLITAGTSVGPRYGRLWNRLTIDTSSWTNAGELQIGRNGAAEIRNGSSVSTDTIVMQGSNFTSLVIDRSSVANFGPTWFAQGTPGSDVVIRNGGWLADEGGHFDYGSSALVTGLGSTWQSQALSGGSHGGLLQIQEGGQVIARSAAFLTEQTVDVAVDGAGSALRVSGQLWLGGWAAYGVFASLEASRGGSIQSGSARIGDNLGPGRVTVANAGSRFETGLLDISYPADYEFSLSSFMTVLLGGSATTDDAYLACLRRCEVFVEDAGSIWRSAGTVYVGRELSGELLPGRITIANDGVVEIANRADIEPPGELLLHNGTIVAPEVHLAGGALSGWGAVHGSVANEGLVSPGEGPGALVVTGDYAQSPAGTLAIGLAGTQPGVEYDVLQVDGAASLAGSLSVALENGFVPSLGQRFDVVVSAALSGDFASIAGLDLGGGLRLHPLVTSSGVSLVTVTQAGLPDADGDLIADAFDNCPFAANTDQADQGGRGLDAPPDGIGDACQCGDVSGDGRITQVDAIEIGRALLEPPTAVLARAELCDVGGSSGCSQADALIVRRALIEPPTATLQQSCGPALP